MTAEHTPGPWYVYDDGDDEESSDIITGWIDNEAGGDNWDIAVIPGDRPIGERKANAHLMAAAPELLAALENLVASIENVDFSSHAGVYDQIPWARAEAALARAKAGGTL
jgi:hypothetical protein